jgi:hypothetical protein
MKDQKLQQLSDEVDAKIDEVNQFLLRRNKAYFELIALEKRCKEAGLEFTINFGINDKLKVENNILTDIGKVISVSAKRETIFYSLDSYPS